MVEIHVLSVKGAAREENQDAGIAWRSEAGRLALIVSDGMGGHVAGRQASLIAVRTCLETVREGGGAWEEVLPAALEAAHRAVLEAIDSHPEYESMGATLAVAVIDGDRDLPSLHVCHVGDSRVYLYRGRSLYRLTVDHSMVSQMVKDGLLSEQDAFGHPDGNVIQRAIGQSAELSPESQQPMALEPGDVVLVCSDGLHGALPDEAIGSVIDGSAGVERVCHELLAAALEAGGQDDITIACGRIGTGSVRRRPTRVID